MIDCMVRHHYYVSVTQTCCAINQFTCSNGRCIPGNQRCDGKRDQCKIVNIDNDESDEDGCSEFASEQSEDFSYNYVAIALMLAVINTLCLWVLHRQLKKPIIIVECIIMSQKLYQCRL